jgi:hypothetical protein
MNFDELKDRIEQARAMGITEITIEDITYKIGLPPLQHLPISSEISAEELIKPLSSLDELTEEEVMYYSCPYFDELQARKKALQDKQAEESAFRKTLEDK